MDAKLLRELENVEPVLAYDRARLEEFFTAAAAERERLRAALDDARRQLAAVQASVVDKIDLEERLSAMLLAYVRGAADEGEACERRVRAIVNAAETQAAKILSDAQAKAAALRAEIGLGDKAMLTDLTRPCAVHPIHDHRGTDPTQRGRFTARAVAV
jgi:cell division septum initiation protein DivIVA